MKIGFIVNDVQTEKEGYTTTRMAMAALNRGHEVWVIGVADLAYDPDEQVRAKAYCTPKKAYKSLSAYMGDLKGRKARSERICVDDLDVLMLRNDPSDDVRKRPWAQTVGINFGRMAIRRGVIVLNDPNGLAKALNKMYFQHFPEEVRPRTLITRSNEEIRQFARDSGSIVIKPVQGSQGTNVFLVREEDIPNLNQMVDAVLRDGYVVAQEYLQAAEHGDTRLFMMNGRPLKHKGKYAAFRRVRTGGDLRSNVHAGGTLDKAEIDDTALELAEMVRPKIVQDGMFLVGLDIVGDKLMEINVFSPGGFGSAQKFENVNFARTVIQALERKVDYMKYYRRNFNNTEMATL
ncbi:MAG: glutathione synthase [Myxococcota bacterium]|nr:glutathione synthase [Myxococcota bacterium]